jgi:hypothetical protein
MPFYLAPYTGRGTVREPFHPVGQPQKSIDLRPDPSRAAGYALCWHPTRLNDGRLDFLGMEAEEPLLPATRELVALRLGVTLNFLGRETELRIGEDSQVFVQDRPGEQEPGRPDCHRGRGGRPCRYRGARRPACWCRGRAPCPLAGSGRDALGR